jgi:aryl-alcohol dehydrogenase-like predicted oxidoreductase
MHYSLLGRDVEREVLPMMRMYGLGLTVWSPLSSGFLSGKYTRESLSDPSKRNPGFDLLPFDREHGLAVLDQMRIIARSHGSTVVQVALAWLLAKDAVTSVILGAAKPDQLKDNLGAIAVKLTAEEVASLDSATALAPVYPNWFNHKMSDRLVAEAIA